jgi:ribokinase
MDLIVRVPRLPTPGQTLLGGELLTLPGGKGANQAVAAARAGARVEMIGAVGGDSYGDSLVEVVQADGVDAGHVRRRRDMPTGVAVIVVGSEAGGENMIVVASGANGTVTPADVHASRSAIEAADVTLLQLECPLDAVIEAATMAKRAGRAVVLNAAPARALPRELLRSVDVLIVNRSEAAMLTGMAEAEDPDRLLAAAAGLGPWGVVLTLGSHGARARLGAAVFSSPAFRVTSVDAVAAGDAFVGTLAACLSSVPPDQRERPEALCRMLTLASAAGALATTKAGAIPSLPTLAEVRALASSQPQSAARRA